MTYKNKKKIKMQQTKIFSLPHLNHYNLSNHDLLEYFLNTWNLSEMLYSSINHDAMFYSSDSYRHPIIFYLGHTAVFYINKLIHAKLIKKRINYDYEKLFAEGVDPEHYGELKKVISWPSYKEVKEYRQKVLDCVLELIERINCDHINSENPEWALLMAIDHDRIHFETSSVLIRQYSVNVLKKPLEWVYAPIINNKIEQLMISIPENYVVLGKPQGHPNFGWDNEYGYSNVKVNSFYASKNLISNIEFLEFVQDKGYNNSQLWSEEGWKWKIENDIKHPKFWIPVNGVYLYRTLYDNITMPLNWPVEVNFYEAHAYCNWIGNNTRLMTEPEFELLAKYSNVTNEPFLEKFYNVNLKFGSPCSVENFESNNSQKQFNDVYGNVFQWLDTPFYPLPGFKTHYLYPHFSYPYFGGNHAMLKGGSWASTGASSSKYYRLWFRKNMYQHAGFRIVRNLT